MLINESLSVANGTIDSPTSTAIAIGTAANAKTITIGNVTTSTGIVLNAGTGGLSGTVIDTDTALTANSTVKVATQNAVKTYVQNFVAGLAFRPPIQLKDDAQTNVGGNVVGQTTYTADGVALTNGMRILFTAETTAPATYLNRVFLVSGVGTSIVLTLQTDGQSGTGAPANADTLFCQQGTSNANKTFTYFGGTWNQSGASAALSIGAAITSATPGSVLFANASSQLGQNNPKFFWDNTNFRLGIGTASPSAELTFGASSTINTLSAGNLTVKTDTTGTLALDSGTTGTINIGTGPNAKTINIGNTTLGTAATVLNIGSSVSGSSINAQAGTSYIFDGLAATTYSIAASAVAGTITIGGTGQTGLTTIGNSSATNTFDIASGAGATALRIANNQVGGSVSIGNGMVAGTIGIGGTAQTGNLTLGRSTAAQTTNIANLSGGIQTINIGNGTTGNTVSINSGAYTATATTNIMDGASSGGNGTLNVMTQNQNNQTTINIQTGNGGGNSIFNLQTGASGGTNTVNVLTGIATAGTQTFSLLSGVNTVAQVANIGTGNGAANKTINIGNGTPTAGLTNVQIGNTSNFARVDIKGAETRSFVSVAATGSVAAGTRYEMVTGTFTRSLPASVGLGRIISIKNNGGGTVTVNVTGAETIDNGTSFSTTSIALTSDVSQDFIDVAAGNGWTRI